MFSTAPASTIGNVYNGFTGQKSKSPNVYAVPYGFTCLDPQEGGYAYLHLNHNRNRNLKSVLV